MSDVQSKRLMQHLRLPFACRRRRSAAPLGRCRWPLQVARDCASEIMRKTRKKKCLSPCARIVGLASSVPSASSHSSMLGVVGFVTAGPCSVPAACQLGPPSSTSRSSARLVAERQEGVRVGLDAAADMSLCGVAITRCFHKSLSTFEHSLPTLASVAPARCAARRQTMMTVKADASAAWRQHRRQPLTTTGGKAQDPSCGRQRRQVDQKQGY
jgi:hypothetical protein